MNVRAVSAAVFLFLSGMSALIYQVAWMREFRLVFGATTSASAAVMAIFMGGLGLGGVVLGRRADCSLHPLRLYAKLLLLISVAGAASPFLIDVSRHIYIAVGGESALGTTGAIVVRLGLASLVLGLPTFWMGGTVPAVVKAVATAEDRHRRIVGVLYGVNTLGAVLGALLSTFVALEVLGTRWTLWLACLVNLAVAGAAKAISTRYPIRDLSTTDTERDGDANSEPLEGATALSNDMAEVPSSVVYAAAGIVGFVFFLMELVWYRMLGPILGGTTFTFGLILAVALCGIGLGGAAYTFLFRTVKPTLSLFALTCALEAVCIAVPLALGDRIAVLADIVRDLHVYRFYGGVAGWTIITSVVVFPAAFISGLQFPLIIALLGRSNVNVGKQVGMAFAFNAVGSIGGSLAGGFGLIPWLSAPGAWRACVVLLAILAISTLWISWRTQNDRAGLLLPAGAVAVAMGLLMSTGPTAVWRHGAIGAGRSKMPRQSSNDLHGWMNDGRRRILWEADGVETSVAISTEKGIGFIVDGKGDGHSVLDAPTQIMLGILPGILHPNPKSALVVGLGTGETAGWLADVQSVEKVTVVELEPRIDTVARYCAAVNRNVLDHPKVEMIHNDAREVLLTSAEKFDLIISEPSNPYRAGIASLFTREFYQAVEQRLNEDGLMVQWMQSYEIDVETVRTVLTTLDSVFGSIEIWQSQSTDLLLVCSRKPVSYSAELLRQRLSEEPFRSALAAAWRDTQLPALLARHVAGPAAVKHVVKQARADVNTDDRNRVEYGFARTVGRKTGFSVESLRELAIATRSDRPPIDVPQATWELVDDYRQLMYALERNTVRLPRNPTDAQKDRAAMLQAHRDGDAEQVLRVWESKQREPVSPSECLIIGSAYALTGNGKAKPFLDQLAQVRPVEATALTAALLGQQRRLPEAVDAVESAFLQMRSDPWAFPYLLEGTFALAKSLARQNSAVSSRLYQALSEPFAVYYLDELRRTTALQIARQLGTTSLIQALEPFEPHVIWKRPFLEIRQKAYAAGKHPLAEQAARDLDSFISQAPDNSLQLESR